MRRRRKYGRERETRGGGRGNYTRMMERRKRNEKNEVKDERQRETRERKEN